MAKTLRTSCGKTIVVDDDVYEWAKDMNWRCSIGYARTSRNIDKQQVTSRLHHMIVGKPVGKMVIDHINGDRLDNRRENLRIVTQSMNRLNSKIDARNTTGLTGVSYDAKKSKYRATINYKHQALWLGYYDTKEEAADIRAKVEVALYGEQSGHHRRYAC